VCNTSLFGVPQVPLSEEERAAQKAKPEKMAIGGDGGFQVLPVIRPACSSPFTPAAAHLSPPQHNTNCRTAAPTIPVTMQITHKGVSNCSSVLTTSPQILQTGGDTRQAQCRGWAC